jgi:hypothetical protein
MFMYIFLLSSSVSVTKGLIEHVNFQFAVGQFAFIMNPSLVITFFIVFHSLHSMTAYSDKAKGNCKASSLDCVILRYIIHS